jgi:hypothetical protein
MCGQMPCKYCNDAGCCTSDPTGKHCKNKNPLAKDCPEPKPCQKDKDEEDDHEEDDHVIDLFFFKLKQVHIIYGSLGLAGLCSFACTFYIAWHCYLRDKIKDMLNDYICCGMGEYILCIIDFLGCCKDAEEEDQPVRRITRHVTRQMTRQATQEVREIIDSPKHQTVLEMSNIKTESPRRRIVNRAFI